MVFHRTTKLVVCVRNHPFTIEFLEIIQIFLTGIRNTQYRQPSKNHITQTKITASLHLQIFLTKLERLMNKVCQESGLEDSSTSVLP